MVLSIFKALADLTRLRLLHLLIKYELSVNELVKVLDMGQSRISRHLRILSEAGLLTWRRNGLWVFYRAVGSGMAGGFLGAVAPYMQPDAQMLADLARAQAVIAERDERSRAYFNAMAENWEELNRRILGDFDLPERVAASLPAGCGTAVDLGCGTGAVLARFRRRAERIIGVDGAAAMLDLCRKRFSAQEFEGGSVSLRIGELSHLPLRDQEADFASLNLVLHHLADPAGGLAEIRRIMAPGGLLFLSDFLLHEDESMRTLYGDQWLGFEEASLLDLLAENGFAPRRTERVEVGNGLTMLLILANTKETI